MVFCEEALASKQCFGDCFLHSGIEMLSLGSFKTGAILLGMKLLPMGRKSLFYLTIYGSVVGVGSYAVHYFSTLVASILENFGLSEEMHNPAESTYNLLLRKHLATIYGARLESIHRRTT
ncbi:uncharacterized protein [Oryza sativa Japonica Group]|uniref:uncharacterized protein isoform X4 n=1 Tax=Oryza sativa subsp. japonica TaxID=39947 RepID=UPI00339C585C